MEEGQSAVKRVTQYFTDSVEELKKVSAPTKQETWQATVVTVLIIGFVALVVALLDMIFGGMMSQLVASWGG